MCILLEIFSALRYRDGYEITLGGYVKNTLIILSRLGSEFQSIGWVMPTRLDSPYIFIYIEVYIYKYTHIMT